MMLWTARHRYPGAIKWLPFFGHMFGHRAVTPERRSRAEDRNRMSAFLDFRRLYLQVRTNGRAVLDRRL